jgi:hypothetical protein
MAPAFGRPACCHFWKVCLAYGARRAKNIATWGRLPFASTSSAFILFILLSLEFHERVLVVKVFVDRTNQMRSVGAALDRPHVIWVSFRRIVFCLIS